MVPVAANIVSTMLDICLGSQGGFTIKLYFSEKGIYREIKGEAEQIKEVFLITQNIWGKKWPVKAAVEVCQHEMIPRRLSSVTPATGCQAQPN